MNLLSEILNTRETSLAIWVMIALIALLFGKSTRKSFGAVIKAFFAKKLIIWWLAMVIYIGACVSLFYHFGLWTPDLLKETVFYILFSASITFFKANKISGEKHFFREMLKDNLKLGILLEFLIGLYTFDLWIELLIVPFAVLLGGMQAIAARDEKYQQVNSLINWIWAIAGIAGLIHLIHSVTLHFQDLLSLESLRQILLAPNLTLIYIPFLYVLSLHMVYETQFILLGFKVRDADLKKFSRRQAILRFKTDEEGLSRWVSRWNLMRPQTRQEVINTINELKAQQQLEKSPAVVLPVQGWSPYVAKDFLPDEELKAGYYDPSYEDKWSARSGSLRLDKDWSGNAITYLVTGNRFAAHQLELRLVAYEPEKVDGLLEVYVNRVALLFKTSTDVELPAKFVQGIAKGKTVKYKSGFYTARFYKEEWQNISKSYDLNFSISVKNENHSS